MKLKEAFTLQQLQSRELKSHLDENLLYEAGQSWVVMGATGSGKTTLTMRLVPELRKPYPKSILYFLDSKPDLTAGIERLPGLIESETAPDVRKLVRNTQVWRNTGYDDHKEYAKWLEDIFQQAHHSMPTFVHINELSSLAIGDSGRSYPNILQKMMKQGRTKKITMIIEFQDIYYLPRSVLGQSIHQIQLRLGNIADVEKMTRHLGNSLKIGNPTSKHGFFYRNLSNPLEDVAEYLDWKEFLGI
jgi:ABC-type oligopeptide transport system ATPase subunit